MDIISEQQQIDINMFLILFRRYKAMSIRTAAIALFLCALYLSMSLFAVLKVNHASSLTYQGKPISIRRDQFNIPDIAAPDFRAAMFAWGYVTAEDRLFQMSFRRLLGSGRLSEFLGEKAIKVDKIFRELNMKGYSDKTALRMRAENESAFLDFQSYADGINSYTNSLKFYPMEFYMLGLSWEDWTVSDMFVIFKLLKWSQSGNMGDEYIRSILLKTMSKEQIDKLMPYQQKYWQKAGIFAHETIVKDDEIPPQTNPDPQHLPKMSFPQIQKLVNAGPMEYLDSHQARGSNSWVVSGQHTESGHPLLCNDPHLDSAYPGQWHQIRIKYFHNGDKCTIVGAAIVGSPAFIGKTSYMSIALTTIYDDIQDLYKERVEGDKYFYEGEWRALKTRSEEIKVKGGSPVVHKISETHHGPIISHILHRGYIYEIEENISLTWAGFTDSQFITLAPLSHVAEVKDWKTLQEYIPRMIDHGPTMNFLYLTQDDHYGYTAVGPSVIRRHPYMGMYVKDGTDSQYEWVGLRNGRQKLHIEDPKRGYIVTANNKPAGNGFQNGVYEPSMFTARADRIQYLIKDHLSKGLKFNKEKMKQIQQDNIDIYCVHSIRAISSKLEKGNKEFNQLFSALKGFDCNFTIDSTQAPLFLSFYQNLYEQRYPVTLDKQFALGMNMGFMHRLYHFIIDASTPEELSVLNKAMRESWQEMSQFFGTKDVSQFRYGKFHTDRMVHRPFGQVQSLAAFFERTSEGWGTQNTPNVGYMSKLHSKDYSTYHRANIRTIISYFQDSEWIIDSGTSERVYSKHYDDQTELFMNNQYILMDPVSKPTNRQEL